MKGTVNLQDLKVEDIEKVYRGVDGCWCGCRGTWSYSDESPRRVQNVINDLKARANDLQVDFTSGVLYVTYTADDERQTRRAIAAYVR